MKPLFSHLALAVFATVALAASPRAQRVTLPVTFENTATNYELTDFGGAISTLVADPTNAANRVVRTVRPAAAECFAGTTLADVTGFTARIPFTATVKTMSVRVWSPAAGIRVLFKVEEVGNPGLNAETFRLTTAAGAWETLVFDFGNPMPNMNPLQIGANYNKASIFFDFQCGLPGAPAADRTYYWDDVTFGGTPPPPPPPTGRVTLPITFQDVAVNYELTDFGGAMSTLVADPANAANRVVRTVRPAAAECFAGTTVADVSGFASRIPFTATVKTMSVRVWSPAAGIRVLFKVEEVGNPGLNVETFRLTTAAGAWETLVFDFGRPMPNMNPLQIGANYNKASIFFDFQCGLPGAPAADRTYYWDDVTFGGTPPPPPSSIALPVTFENTAVNYELTDFGGAMSTLVADPANAANRVVRTVRPAAAECFAGTTVADVSGFASRIPFTATVKTMSVRVWSPAAGIRVLFKVEEVGNPGLNVETFRLTTAAGAWETLVFDFGRPMPNMNPLQIGANYNKASIFFDFQCGLPGAPAASRTFYWDDVAFRMPTASETAPSAFTTTPTAFPNPTTGDAFVSFGLKAASDVSLEVFDGLGRRVALSEQQSVAAGTARLAIPTAGLTPGVYVVRVRTTAGVATARFSVVR